MPEKLKDILRKDIQGAIPEVPKPILETSILCMTVIYHKLYTQPPGSTPSALCAECLTRLPQHRQHWYVPERSHFLLISRTNINFECHKCGVVLGKCCSWGECPICRVTYPQFLKDLQRRGQGLDIINSYIKIYRGPARNAPYAIRPRRNALPFFSRDPYPRGDPQDSANLK